MENLSSPEFKLEAPVGNNSAQTGAFVASFPIVAFVATDLFIPFGASQQIVSSKSICGGAPTIAGTRISVHHLISQMQKLGWTQDRILQSYPHLSSAHVESVLRYYEEHRAEIDALIEREDALGT